MTRSAFSAPADTTRVGTLSAPHGVQGGIKLFVLGDPAQLRQLSRVYVEGRGWLKLTRTEGSPPGIVLHLAGVQSREAAEALRGLNVYAADAELPPLEAGSFYYHDLRGLNVVGPAGQDLGVVSDVLDMGHQDLLVVGEGQAYLPLQAPYVVIHQQGKKPVRVELTADTPEGLIEAEASDQGQPEG